MRSTSFQRVSQLGALLFLAAFTLMAWVGSGSLTAGQNANDAGAPAILVQTDNDSEIAAGVETTDDPTNEPATEDSESDEPVVVEPIDSDALVPPAGSSLTVVGVEPDDVLNFRTSPDPGAAIVVTKPASERSEIVTTGKVAETRAGGVWWEVSVDGQTGWANARFLSQLGEPRDITVELVGDLPTLRYDSPMAAALAVADTMATTDPTSEVTIVNEPVITASGGVIFVDVVGIGSESTDGYRLRVEILPVGSAQSGEDGVWVSAAQAFSLCRLGVVDGLCA